MYRWLTPFNIGGLTIREWQDIQSDLYQMERARKEEERMAKRRARR